MAESYGSIFGKRLRHRRRVLDITQHALARGAGVPLNYFHAFERGKRSHIPFRILVYLAFALRTTTDYLLGVTDESEIPPDAEPDEAQDAPETEATD
jgi:transcriptional regulator with XRE-family HTH domain